MMYRQDTVVLEGDIDFFPYREKCFFNGNVKAFGRINFFVVNLMYIVLPFLTIGQTWPNAKLPKECLYLA